MGNSQLDQDDLSVKTIINDNKQSSSLLKNLASYIRNSVNYHNIQLNIG